MDIAVVVDYIGQIAEVGKNKTPMRKVKVTQLDTRENYEVSVFLGKNKEDDFNFVVGQEVVMDLETSEYKGKTQYSAGAWKCKPLTGSPKTNIYQDNKPDTMQVPIPAVNSNVYQTWYDGKFKRFCDICNIIKEMSPEYQQAIAKDIKELIL